MPPSSQESNFPEPERVLNRLLRGLSSGIGAQSYVSRDKREKAGSPRFSTLCVPEKMACAATEHFDVRFSRKEKTRPVLVLNTRNEHFFN